MIKVLNKLHGSKNDMSTVLEPDCIGIRVFNKSVFSSIVHILFPGSTSNVTFSCNMSVSRGTDIHGRN
jgi:hypothetical protein